MTKPDPATLAWAEEQARTVERGPTRPYGEWRREMTRDEMVEQLARAICESDVTAPEPDAPIYVGMKTLPAWQGRIVMAEAVLAEIKAMGLVIVPAEPTPAMISAAEAVDMPPCDDYSGGEPLIEPVVRKAWAKMLSAAPRRMEPKDE